MSSGIVIVGGGQSGAQAVETLRREGFAGSLTLISDEALLPYQRPPLSKKYLSAELAADRLLIRHQGFYDEHQVNVRLNTKATGIDRRARLLSLDGGETITYEQLLLCTGARSRRLTCNGNTLAGIHYLRDVNDVSVIQPKLVPGVRVVIVGGGYIGLEVAATARKRGCSVTVLELADRIMNRVVAPNVSQYFEIEHRRNGVVIICNTRVDRLDGDGRVERVICSDGNAYTSDLLVVGVGATPNTEIAETAGLDSQNGVVVDEYCRTSDPMIFAAGDCCNHPSLRFGVRVRLECVDNAFEQGKTAALNMLGKTTVHDRVPWFWSDQYDNKLLIVGLSQGNEQQITRGDPASRSFSICHVKDGELRTVETVNRLKDYMSARKLIAARVRVDSERLADVNILLADTALPSR